MAQGAGAPLLTSLLKQETTHSQYDTFVMAPPEQTKQPTAQAHQAQATALTQGNDSHQTQTSQTANQNYTLPTRTSPR